MSAQIFNPAQRIPRPFPLVLIFSLLLYVLFGIHPAFSQSRDVVINEIAWSGTAASSTDEWIELYNNTDSPVDLTGWTLAAVDGDPSITLSGQIGASGYFLLERTDDNTVLDLIADQVYTGGLSNTGEHFHLRNGSGQLIDEVNCAGGWFAGSSSPRASMERRHPTIDGSLEASWETNDGVTKNGHDANGDALLGTPVAQNSAHDISLSVAMLSFTAFRSNGAIMLKWTTASETGNLGFHVHRSEKEDGPYTKISGRLIASGGNSSAGTDYEYWDHTASDRPYWYKLESVSSRGLNKWHGPVFVKITANDGPDTFRLVGNYPNPFNPCTTILYEISTMNTERWASLKIFDILGREVLTLVDETHSPGRYSVRWNGRDAHGREVSSGRYWCRLMRDEGTVDAIGMTKTE